MVSKVKPAKPFTLAVKEVASLAMPTQCRRCFWLKRQTKLPFQIFAGILSSMDAHQKRIVSEEMAASGQIPTWLKCVGHDLTRVVPFTRGKIPLPSGTVVSGSPDLVLANEAQELTIIDFKSAKFTENQIAVLPLYQAQLNGYALMVAAATGLEVKRLMIVYCQPQTDITMTFPGGYALTFVPHIEDVPLDPAGYMVLANEAERIALSPTPPEGKVDCDDCRLVQALVDAHMKGAPLVSSPVT